MFAALVNKCKLITSDMLCVDQKERLQVEDASSVGEQPENSPNAFNLPQRLLLAEAQ